MSSVSFRWILACMKRNATGARSRGGSTILLRLAVAAIAACLVLWCGLRLWAETSAILGHSHYFRAHHDSVPLGLQRSAAAAALEKALDNDVNVGPCTAARCMLPGMSELDCASMYCMWSPKLQTNVDLWFDAFQSFDYLQHSPTDPCHEPRGGQVHNAHHPILVAFIITVHNNATLAAEAVLETFRAAGEVESAEIIVVDDGSTEDMGVLQEACRRLTAYFGTRVQYLANRQALGFEAASIQGVRASSAEHVMLLNSDAFLMNGAAYALLRTIQEVPDAGIVGPLLIGANHRASGAGGILFADGLASDFARGSRVGHDLNFRRPVDYISAACMLVRREVFLEVGGINPGYQQRGFLEDVDLAMAVRSSGLQVVYQPLAVVLHLEGSALAQNNTRGKQERMAADQKMLTAKWKPQLGQHCGNGVGDEWASKRLLSPRVLWVVEALPEPDRDTASARTWNMMQILLHKGYHVALQRVGNSTYQHPTYIQQARFAGVDVLPRRRLTKRTLTSNSVCIYDAILIAGTDTFSSIRDTIRKACPYVRIIFDSGSLRTLAEARGFLADAFELTKPSPSCPSMGSGDQCPCNAVQEFMSEVAKAVRDADPDGALAAPQSDDSWDLSYLSLPAVLKYLETDDMLLADVLRVMSTELSQIDDSAVTLVGSDIERQLILHYRPQANVQLLPGIFAFTPPPPSDSCPSRTGVLFIGDLRDPTANEAAKQLVSTIMPRAKELLPPALRPTFILHIVSGFPPRDRILETMLNSSIDVGDVVWHEQSTDAVRHTLFSSVKAVVLPWFGGGDAREPVMDAIRFGVPVVATPIAVEGMQLDGERGCLLARSQQEFAAQVVGVYTDCRLWQTLVQGGYDSLVENFSMEVGRAALLGAFRTAGVGPVGPQRRGVCDARTEGDAGGVAAGG